ncbi:TPA: integrase arm-type DNA-binding domain-containing protein [Pseudomonas putida]|uniref:tyrosine-type recombinase/integrase n=1 Tax=Pseudomonas sp. HD6515 TaxID=2856556 RepID=UPI00217E9FD3|nr:integrase arm-type DNA-binding domain-containing protein [Pseudomonas sp. HD6515]ELS0926041.1 integrase arm-type DNA-binding domain-containing protein [Pseudomonas putida]UWH23446.1 integrase arm-type DNA-binding domain-containing protein [Pseudomonas sp. HD6515]HDS0940929.1 integrase arm-type DNA-binding domain-containing protein [Pseudomonas putida]
MPLTDTAARQAKPQDKPYSLKDGDGLFLYVAKNGTKSWHFRFTWHGKQERISMGTYPEISLRDARDRRDEARSQVAKGVDPRIERRQAKAEAAVHQQNTFEAVANRWHEFKLPRWAAARKGSAVQSRFYLDKDLIPELGKLPIAQIKRGDVLEAMRRVERRGALNSARKCRSWLHEIFRFGMAEGLLEVNPAADLDIVAVPEPPEQHNPYLRRHELKEFLVTLRDFKCAEYARSAVKLLLLTGVRTIELRSATFDQFDFVEGLWTIPPGIVKQLQKRVRTKSGEIPPYLVPLSRQAMEEAKRAHEVTGRYRMLIAGRNDPRKPISDGTVNSLLKRMGYQGRLTGHGIRATISTALNEMGYNEKWIDAQLSHIGDAYNHAEFVEQRRGMMQDWADYLDGLLAE